MSADSDREELGEEAAQAHETPGQEVVHPLDKPIKPTGGLMILSRQPRAGGRGVQGRGQRAPAPSRARARVRQRGSGVRCGAEPVDQPNDVVVIRYEGPSGGPGMREMLSVTSAIVGAGTRRQGCAHHRRTVLWRQPWVHRRAHRSRGCAWRADRAGAGRRLHRARHGQARARGGGQRAGTAEAEGEMDRAEAALHDGRDGEIRAPRVVGIGGSGHGVRRAKGRGQKAEGRAEGIFALCLLPSALQGSLWR